MPGARGTTSSSAGTVSHGCVTAVHLAAGAGARHGGSGPWIPGRTLAAATGATLKELMARLGHFSTRAAMIYQHATRNRDQVIAKAPGSWPARPALSARTRLTTADMWPVYGPSGIPGSSPRPGCWCPFTRLNLAGLSRWSGRRNRTLMTSLEDRWRDLPRDQRKGRSWSRVRESP
jgi:hypothetical protein